MATAVAGTRPETRRTVSGCGTDVTLRVAATTQNGAAVSATVPLTARPPDGGRAGRSTGDRADYRVDHRAEGRTGRRMGRRAEGRTGCRGDRRAERGAGTRGRRVLGHAGTPGGAGRGTR
ncbi:hypothetical protein GCM10017559_51690 [Streptosporangium longisporum]|uniref:Uncharacterized protein n=1 Tax=Streptosporangium longisporum TaxID=46187 RepID=A0ABN3Y9Z1_9ACTN